MLQHLDAFLVPLEKEGLICGWTDRHIEGGQRWRDEIDAALDAARIAVLLISQDFYTSEFIRDVELPRLLSREASGLVTILPVFVSPADAEHAVAFTDEHGVSRQRRLSDIQGGVAHPSRTLAEMGKAKQAREFLELVKRIRALVADVQARSPTATTDVAQIAAAQRHALAPPPPSSDHYSLTVEIQSAKKRLSIHYWLHNHQLPALERSRPQAEGLLNAARAGQGEALFELLFGDESRWEPIFRALFGYPDQGPRPNPTRGGVRLRICVPDAELLALPWLRLSWNGRLLIQDRWEIATVGDVSPARDCKTAPAGEFLVVVPDAASARQASDNPGAPMARLIEELWPRPPGAPAAARMVTQAAQLDAALQGMWPHGLYLRAALAIDTDTPSLLLDGPHGSTTYPLARLADHLRAMDPPPSILILDLVELTSPEIPARLALELGERIALVLWRARPSGAEQDQILLAALRRWLGGGEDPVAALHAVLRGPDPGARTTADSVLGIHANYRSWQTATATRSPAAAPPRLALDRDMQKALVTRHLGELVRSPRVRVMAMVAYGSRENRLCDLTEQLEYELDLTAADWAAIEWHRVGLPEDRSDLRGCLGAHIAEVLGAVSEEPLAQLLRRNGPRGLRPGLKGVVWLDWGALDDSEPARAWPDYGELSDWLAFCSEALPTQCPSELRVVCSIAIELPEEKYDGLAGWLDALREESWYLRDGFRFLGLNPLGRVDPDHLRDYLAAIETGLDELSRTDLVRLIRQKTAGAFDATVRLLDEGRSGSWIALLQRLKATDTKADAKRRSQTL